VAVVDASVLVAYLAGGEAAGGARAALGEQRGALWAPHLVDAEVGHVLRRSVQRGELAEAVAREALVDLADLPLRRAGHRGLLARAWELHENVSFYDALYVALAERLDLPVLTLDARLSRGPGLRAEIVVVR
jgi:predicted nucleic acid-binding protein